MKKAEEKQKEKSKEEYNDDIIYRSRDREHAVHGIAGTDNDGLFLYTEDRAQAEGLFLGRQKGQGGHAHDAFRDIFG